MFLNYLKIAWRNLIKNKLYSVIIISGLCIGLSCCLLIFTYIRHELSYDQFHSQKDRIARVIMEYSFGGNVNKGNYTSTKVGPSFKDHFPEVENFVRLTGSSRIVRRGDETIVEKRFVYADSTFFQVFDFPMIAGNKLTALNKPNSVVISEAMRRKYFGDENPVGKTLLVSARGVEYRVTGVVSDCPANSQIKYDFIASFSSLGQSQVETYWNANYTTYVLLKDQTAMASLASKIPDFMRSEMAGILNPPDYLTYELEPLTRVHLYSPYPGFEPNGNVEYVFMTGIIALISLLIGSFTYVNLSTAKSSERAKEIGIRKVSGAARAQLFFQFMGESLVVVSLSCVVSVGITALAMPYFASLMDRQLSLGDLQTWPFVCCALALVLSVVLLGGAYPALVLAGFKPVSVLKGAFKNSSSGILLRNYLFVAQFAIAAFLIVCSLVVQKQLWYIQHKDVGFDREQVVVLPSDQFVMEKYELFRQQLKTQANVKTVSRAHFVPSDIMGGYTMSKPGMSDEQGFAVNAGGIDEEYLQTNGLRVLAGENINKQDVLDAVTDNEARRNFHFILNESAARQLGWSPQEAIGKKMLLDASRSGVVKAVVADFHFSSIHNPIKPLVLFPDDYGVILMVKLPAQTTTASVDAIKKVWIDLFHHRPFDYQFLNEQFDAMYRSEQQLGEAVALFTGVAVFLSILGLFGLSHYQVVQRRKEISVRKVLGAPVLSLMKNLSSTYLAMVCISLAMAIPLAYLLMEHWLKRFSYHTDIGSGIAVVTVLTSVCICLLTVSGHAFKAAVAKPIHYLRNE